MSSGACNTMMRDPSRHSVHPTRPRWPSSSPSKKEARIALCAKVSSAWMTRCSSAYPIITLRAPSGVTNIGGAKVYAAKFATAQRKEPESGQLLHSSIHPQLTGRHAMQRRLQICWLTFSQYHWIAGHEERKNTGETERSLVHISAHHIGLLRYA